MTPIEARIREMCSRQPFLQHIGAVVLEVAPGRAVLELPVRPEVMQQTGFVHGGAVATMADVAGGFAALTMFDPGSEILTVEFKVNLVAPARGERITAVGEVHKFGRTLTVCGMKVFCHEGTRETLCAVGQQTLMQLPRTDRGASR